MYNNVSIYTLTYNRKKIVDFFLNNINSYREDARLIIFDDHSMDFKCKDYLTNKCDLLICKEQNNKPRILRREQMKHFLDSSQDYFYSVDSDSIHDPKFLDVLISLHKKYNKIISIYNTKWHDTIKEIDSEVVFKKGNGGISMFMDKKQANDIYYNSGLSDDNLWSDLSWDWIVSYYVNEFYVTKTSYCEHLFYNGIHATPTDVAVNPTTFLINERTRFLKENNEFI